MIQGLNCRRRIGLDVLLCTDGRCKARTGEDVGLVDELLRLILSSNTSSLLHKPRFCALGSDWCETDTLQTCVQPSRTLAMSSCMIRKTS
jgi:hypothetical protein